MGVNVPIFERREQQGRVAGSRGIEPASGAMTEVKPVPATALSEAAADIAGLEIDCRILLELAHAH